MLGACGKLSMGRTEGIKLRTVHTLSNWGYVQVLSGSGFEGKVSL